ncbi:armadillo-type protein [Roridomyces roridus]|uniref:Armadillo-type protein n=1 Tax=Roridomyces roridus TaxID=1738132 RepID=A0AAD7B0A5_9AGAR|nr:armadillo-type protein [Roridomyces roridus]
MCKHISFATQRTVLQHLGARAYRQHDAVAILRSPILGQIPELLGSPDRVLRTRTSLLVGGLLAHNFSMEVMSGIIGRIIPMLREANDPAVQKALVEISTHPDCAKAVDTTNAFDRIPELLESDDAEVRWKACAQIESLVRDRPIRSILPAIPLEKLFGLLRDESPEVVHESMTVLTRIAKHPDGAAAEVASPNFPIILELFESKIENMNRRACWLVDAVGKHDLILIPPQVRQILAEKIVNLLDEDDEDVRYAAMRALRTVFPYHPAGFPTWDSSEGE